MAPRFAKLVAPTDAAISTWLAIGALLQFFGQIILPTKVVLLVPVIYVVYRLVIVTRDSQSIYKTSFTSVRQGRWTFQLPEADASDGIVCFVLGARFNQ